MILFEMVGPFFIITIMTTVHCLLPRNEPRGRNPH